MKYYRSPVGFVGVEQVSRVTFSQQLIPSVILAKRAPSQKEPTSPIQGTIADARRTLSPVASFLVDSNRALLMEVRRRDVFFFLSAPVNGALPRSIDGKREVTRLWMIAFYDHVAKTCPGRFLSVICLVESRTPPTTWYPCRRAINTANIESSPAKLSSASGEQQSPSIASTSSKARCICSYILHDVSFEHSLWHFHFHFHSFVHVNQSWTRNLYKSTNNIVAIFMQICPGDYVLLLYRFSSNLLYWRGNNFVNVMYYIMTSYNTVRSIFCPSAWKDFNSSKRAATSFDKNRLYSNRSKHYYVQPENHTPRGSILSGPRNFFHQEQPSKLFFGGKNFTRARLMSWSVNREIKNRALGDAEISDELWKYQ